MANQKLQIDILANDKSKQAFNKVQGSIARVKSSIFNLKNAFIGLGAGVVLKGIINAGMQIEELGVQLEALFGSAKKGKEALDVVTKFAKTTPFELSNIQQGVTALATVSEKAESLGITFEELLKITGNTAVQLGGDFALASQQIQRSFSAGIGSADLFRDRAVTAMAGFSAGVKTSVDDSIKGLARAFGTGGKFGELTNKLAGTLKGTISNLKDAFFTVQTEIASGFFDELKRQLGDLKEFTETNDQAIRRLSREMGENFAVAILELSKAIKILTTNFRELLDVVGLLMVAFGGLASKIVGTGIVLNNLFKRFKDFFGKENEIKINLDALYDDMPQAIEEVKESVVDLAKAQESIAEAREKELKLQNFLLKEANEKRLKFHELETEGVKKFREQNDIQGQVLQKIKEQNSEFSLSSEIVSTITSFTSRISRSIAEAVVLGKSLNMSFKELAQQLLVDVLAKMIERIMLLTIEKFIIEKIFKQDTKKLDIEKSITREKRKQVVYQALLMAMGGGGGSGIPGFANGGAVSKGQPIVVGEQGPELFVPNQTGQITQSARGTGVGGGTTVNFNINTVDASGFEELLIRSRGTITQLINNAVNERGKESLI